MLASTNNKTAIWVITANGVAIARKIKKGLPDADFYASAKVSPGKMKALIFDKLSDATAERFHQYQAHIFVMATGIVVRMIAPFIQNKIEDPAVVVIDDQGLHAISLLAGHLGGANDLTRKVAEMIQADPVITTATDVNAKPAIDVLAKEKKLNIENPPAIKTVNMALLNDQQIWLHDPFAVLQDDIPNAIQSDEKGLSKWETSKDSAAAIYVDDKRTDLPADVLILRPASLIAGIGCNRNTPMNEIKDLLDEVLKNHRLAGSSLSRIASIDLKTDEPGLLELAKTLGLPIDFFSREKLGQVKDIQTPSTLVENHIGVKSVCEAAAILASQMGTLIVPKHKTPNVTVAIARKAFTSSESGPAV
jgi:cobalt-precorrin 5A hydrolase